MTIAIDASSAAKAQKTGVEWHCFYLIEALKKQPLAPDERMVLYSREPLEGELALLPPGWESVVLSWPFRRGWMALRVSFALLTLRPDVCFVPGQALPRFSGTTRLATTIHDIGFMRVPALYSAPERTRQVSAIRRALLRAKALFVVSDFTKKEVEEVFRVSPERMTFAPNAIPSPPPVSEETIRSLQNRLRIGPKSFLFVGRLEEKKNVLTIIQAFELFARARGVGDPFELHLVGRAGGQGYPAIRHLIDTSPVKSRIRELGYIEEEDLRILRAGATGFLFPSWYEGFGIPVLEAQADGVPVIASDIPSLREVGGDAALFATPNAPERFAEAMRRVADDERLRAELIARGKENITRYSWDQTAAIVLETLRSLVQ